MGLMFPKQAPAIKDAKHTGFIHELVCVICGNPEVQQHHLLRGRTRRGQYRAGDNESLPMCARHHNVGPDALHEMIKHGIDEPEFFALHGIKDYVGLSDAIYVNSGDYEACMALIEGARA